MFCLSVWQKPSLSGDRAVSLRFTEDFQQGDVPIFNPGVFSRVVQRMLPSNIPSPVVRS